MQSKADWFETFFNGLALDMWRECITPEKTRAESDFLERALRITKGATVLDIPCGNGHLSIELASRGYRVEGIDISESFIAEARGAAAARGLSGKWETGDMRKLDRNAEFDAAFCFGNSFGYLEDADNRQFLRAVGKSLKRGGRFALDTYGAAESVHTLLTKRWYEVGSIVMLIENEYDIATGRLHTTYNFLRGGERETKTGSQLLYTYREIRGMLREAGFADISAVASLDGEPYVLGSQRLLVECTRC